MRYRFTGLENIKEFYFLSHLKLNLTPYPHTGKWTPCAKLLLGSQWH